MAIEGGTFVSVTGGTIETAMPGTFISAAGGTFETVMPGTFHSATGGTFETVLGGTIKPLPSRSSNRVEIILAPPRLIMEPFSIKCSHHRLSGFNLGTINPLTFDIYADSQWACQRCYQS